MSQKRPKPWTANFNQHFPRSDPFAFTSFMADKRQETTRGYFTWRKSIWQLLATMLELQRTLPRSRASSRGCYWRYQKWPWWHQNLSLGFKIHFLWHRSCSLSDTFHMTVSVYHGRLSNCLLHSCSNVWVVRWNNGVNIPRLKHRHKASRRHCSHLAHGILSSLKCTCQPSPF